jgi:hypothetical protein
MFHSKLGKYWNLLVLAMGEMLDNVTHSQDPISDVKHLKLKKVFITLKGKCKVLCMFCCQSFIFIRYMISAGKCYDIFVKLNVVVKS